METDTTTYRLADAPKFASTRDYDCCRCEHEQLRRPVFLTGPDGVVAAGTRCAAIMLGLVPDTASEPVARKALRVAVDEHRAELERARRERSDAEAAVWFDWLNAHSSAPSVAEQIAELGGFAAARAAYRAR